MKLYCEIVSKDIIPSIRSMISKELMEKYNMNQSQISRHLNVSQPAVSQYIREIRGVKKELKGNDTIRIEVSRLCSRISENGMNKNEIFGEICKISQIAINQKLFRELEDAYNIDH